MTFQCLVVTKGHTSLNSPAAKATSLYDLLLPPGHEQVNSFNFICYFKFLFQNCSVDVDDKIKFKRTEKSSSKQT